ncbi:MAG: peptidylprolyl isomerase, partial [Bacteroidales bacterium]|nr:peptidylprolyl isomerase [Bacteroidales bacterium]
MKTSFLLSSFFALALTAGAQSATDPVLMTINGKPVTKAEFEYSFHKNGNVEGAVEKKTVEEYVPMFINYQLKVAAAEKAGLDTLTSFKKEFHTYRDMQLTPYLVDQHVIDSIAQMVYANTEKKLDGKDLIETAHILIRLDQKATEAQKAAAKA